jgi:secreted trypsin-like serine protease
MRRSLSLVLPSLLGAFACLVGTPAVAAERSVSLQMLGGSTVPQGSLPFLVKVEAQASGLIYSCTGTVIAPTAVLTAGHCAYDAFGNPLPASAYTVTIGTSVVAPVAAQDAGAEHIAVTSVKPYGSSTTTLHGDVAVLQLATPTAAAPVALATPADAAAIAAGTAVTVAGWGKTSDAGTPSPVLRQGVENVLTNGSCLAGNQYFDPRFQLCAQAPANASAICSGDSGGPALVSTAAGWVEVGVVSYHVGEHCGTGADSYARVSTLQPWIASQVAATEVVNPYQPAYAPTSGVRAAVAGGKIAVSFTAATAEAASVVAGYTVTLRTRSGRIVAARNLSGASTRASFASPGAGIYTASVTTRWAAGPMLVASSKLTIPRPRLHAR